MSAQLDNRTRTGTNRRRSVRSSQRSSARTSRGPAVTPSTVRETSHHTARLDLVFQVVLALAACLSLVIVVQQAVAGDVQSGPAPAPASSGQEVDDAPPAVFVQAD